MVTTERTINLNSSVEKANYLKRVVSDIILPAPKNRFFQWGRNVKLSKCIGLIGPRGSGKSLSAAAIAILDYLVPGYNVISNMSIRWGMTLGDYIIGYSSSDLDKAELLNFDIEEKCAIVVDEVNIEFSEARRSTTNRNLIFNKILQQLRKRKLNLIYTTQHEMWIDNRLRWQTDIFIKCQDICLRPGGMYLPFDFGEQINWRVFDMSGFLGRGTYQETQEPVVGDGRFAGKKWWGTYDTDLIQGEDEVSYGHMEVGDPRDIGGEIEKYDWVQPELVEIVKSKRIMNKKYEVAEDDLVHRFSDFTDNPKGAISFIEKYLDIKSRWVNGLKMYRFHNLVAAYENTITEGKNKKTPI